MQFERPDPGDAAHLTITAEIYIKNLNFPPYSHKGQIFVHVREFNNNNFVVYEIIINLNSIIY